MKASLIIVKRLFSEHEMKETEAKTFFPFVNAELATCEGHEKLPPYDKDSFWLPEMQWAIADLLALKEARRGDFRLTYYLRRLRSRLNTANILVEDVQMDLYEWTFVWETGHWE